MAVHQHTQTRPQNRVFLHRYAERIRIPGLTALLTSSAEVKYG